MIALLAVILALVAPAAAWAQGSGGTDEYVEQLPGAGGDKPSSDSGGDAETDEPLTPSAEEAIEEQGADGSAAVELAQSTGPDDGGGGDSGQGGSGGDGLRGSDADSGLPEVIGDVASGSDDSDMGVLLPIVIGATLVAALAFVIIRRRRRHAGS
jgi:hypothetical protein